MKNANTFRMRPTRRIGDLLPIDSLTLQWIASTGTPFPSNCDPGTALATGTCVQSGSQPTPGTTLYAGDALAGQIPAVSIPNSPAQDLQNLDQALSDWLSPNPSVGISFGDWGLIAAVIFGAYFILR
jgi:hypothetical protein